MGSLLKRAVVMGAGVALVLGYWTFRGWLSNDAGASMSHIPRKVSDGGGGSVVIEADTSDPGVVSASFETHDQVDSPDHKFMETWEKIGPGHHTFTIDVPAGVSGSVEVRANEPKVGSRVQVAVKVGARTVAEDSQTLTEPLKPGYGFTAMVDLEDYVTGRPSED